MKAKDIISHVTRTIEPLDDRIHGRLYRCAATLTDGTHLPCVVIKNATKRVDLAIKRFEETRHDKTLHESAGYRATVASFVCSGNIVNDYDIHALDNSPFALPIHLVSQIGGETSMGWTEFIGTMDDGVDFCFGTTFDAMFFNMPEGYIAQRLVKVVPSIRGERRHETVYRERPFFECYLRNV